MQCVASAAGFVMGLAMAGCAGPMDGLSATTSGYYGGPPDVAPGYYQAPYYAAPYPYQPGYVAPYIFQTPGRGRDGWREREWHERNSHEFRNEGPHHFNQQPQNPVPHMSAQPPNMAPAPAPRQLTVQPPVARPPAEQNQRAINQLGFRPSR